MSTAVVAAAVVGGVLALGVGGALAVDAVRGMRFRERARTEFERVDATVLDAAVHEPASGGPEAVPHVEYEYTVDGHTYTSRSLWPTRSRSPDPVDRDVARRVVEDHPAGAEVIARYDLGDPATSYLLAEFDGSGDRIELAAGVGLVVAYVALLALLAVVR